MPREPVVLFQH